MCMIGKTVDSVAHKKGVRRIEVEKAKGGYVVTTHHHDYAKPSSMSIHKNTSSIASHIKSMMPSTGESV